ncbi:MAG: TAXI family TRAP transporter solute-binding subunit [Microbacterium sp.]
MTVRRVLVALLAGLALLACLSGCRSGAAREWDEVPRVIAGGGTTGVYYSYGREIAAALRGDPGVEVQVAETKGSVDNLQRIGAGEAVLGFTQSDAAADAVAGIGDFDAPLPIRAVARLYDEYVHVVVRAESDIDGISELVGRRISLGAEGSGVSVVARRVLEAADVPLGAVQNSALGLGDSIAALEDSRIEAFFWVGGVPTPGIEQLAVSIPIRLLSIDTEVVERANAAHAGVYRISDFPVGAYGRSAPTMTMTVPNYLVTSADVPDRVVRDALASLFAARGEIAREAPAAALLDRRLAIFTDPIPLHPGAEQYYRGVRG